jgi:hypothetical protein
LKNFHPKLFTQGGEQGCQMVSFQTKNPNLGKCLRALPRLENVDILYGHLQYSTNTWDSLGPFGTFCVHLVHFFRFWYHAPKNLATLVESRVAAALKLGL